MAALDVAIVASTSGPTHYVRNEQTGVHVGDGLPIVSQVVLAGVHKRTYVGVQSLLLTTSVQSLTIPAGSPAVLADIYCEGATANDYARYWHNSISPTATVGKKLRDDQEIQSADPASSRWIIGSGTPTLRAEFYTNG